MTIFTKHQDSSWDELSISPRCRPLFIPYSQDFSFITVSAILLLTHTKYSEDIIVLAFDLFQSTKTHLEMNCQYLHGANLCLFHTKVPLQFLQVYSGWLAKYSEDIFDFNKALRFILRWVGTSPKCLVLWHQTKLSNYMYHKYKPQKLPLMLCEIDSYETFTKKIHRAWTSCRVQTGIGFKRSLERPFENLQLYRNGISTNFYLIFYWRKSAQLKTSSAIVGTFLHFMW